MKVFHTALMLILLFYGCSDSDSPTSPDETTSDPVIALYVDDGAWTGGVNRLESAIQSWGWTVRRMTADDILDGQLNASVNAIIFPGGDAGPYTRDLAGTGIVEVQNFVSNGGGFVGICAGAFWAVDRIIWYGTEIDMPLNLISGTATGPLEALANPGHLEWVDVRFDANHPASNDVPSMLSSYYFDGPEFDTPGVATFAWYEALNTPAAVATNFGNGRVAVIGVHPEMSSETHQVLRSMLEWVIVSERKATESVETKKIRSLDIRQPNQIYQRELRQ